VISYGPTSVLVLHRCPSGMALIEHVPEGAEARCTPPAGEACGAPILPDRRPRSGHAWVFCPHCQVSVGLCGSEDLAELAELAAGVLEG
jgi:hypothetical protein